MKLRGVMSAISCIVFVLGVSDAVTLCAEVFQARALG